MSGSPWEIGADTEFVDSVEEIKESEGSLYDNLCKKIEKIKEDPLVGDPKTGLLKGSRTIHVEHLVLRWEVRPEVNSRDHMEKIEEVYFMCLTHHDDMKTGFSSRSPADVSQECVIYFEEFDVGKELNELYNLDYVNLQEPNWLDTGVEVKGTIQSGGKEKLEASLPDCARVEYPQETLI
ncbi:hypothetical protein [Halorussus halophilus]|uniref:hypothetical protein n=1 Tax=Halorussus halophilus TaxID=2650975 RepID=UPI0013012F34|nr:hypothetical protein [Halorussus halophilus]